MPPSLSTSNRMYFLTLHEYGEDDLLIEEMSGHEAMSQLFEFRLRLLSTRDDIDLRKIIAKPAILRIETWDTRHMQGERHWNGVVSRFQRTGRAASAEGEDLYAYECDIVPWFWFMTQHEDCRVFQNKTVREIVETIFGEFDYSDFRFDLQRDYPPLEYCTQYHETTFDFISRLLEREGIHYYFRHNEDAESRHLLYFTDHNRGNPALDPATLPFHHDGHAEDYDAISSLSLDQQMRTRKVTLGDWDFVQKRLLRENTPTMLAIGEDRELERYRYPGGFVEPELGKHRSRIIMEAEEASHMLLRGNSQVRTLAPGHTFILEDHPFDEFNLEYMVLSVWHHGRNNLTTDAGPSDYGNEFTLQPHEVTWRAPLTTPKALVRGPQTALVTGAPGDEIHTDEYGRIKIQFHWDRQGQYDDKSSCWVRVAQVWAGNGYGTMFIPRVGMEVVVDFLEGDPDQPLVTGCVYNGVNMPPQPLPQFATRSGIKTLSSKGGGGTNELGFEDKKGSEEVFLQAEKDFNVNVKANLSESVGGDSNHKIGGKHLTHVGSDHHLKVDGDSHTTVNGEFFQGSKGDLQLHTEQELRVIGNNQVIVASAGLMDIYGGKKLTIEADLLISLKVGSSGIIIDPSGVSVVGPMIKQNSGGAPSSAKRVSTYHTDLAQGAHSTSDGTVTDPGQQLQAQALINAALAGQPFCAECAAARAAYEALMG
jgi:type VI secretion system secreted protein VgrG